MIIELNFRNLKILCGLVTFMPRSVERLPCQLYSLAVSLRALLLDSFLFRHIEGLLPNGKIVVFATQK
ncbi:MAG: hypothetical protein A3H73_02720 [Candidatus Taylorbacteria bacterium RIFCSPLOWO2_02_FULL_50_120]|nr:MAG: hypothetical protein A2W65_03565 [Candidatus Taylorbacteria bacterium RIFCSPLOWO2_02_50_13]OHA40571.1 MAG: hypothetical protein A3H73_02720 [Candidatus Taylorbacteria bacterium RIFCSPLOWO2_02_FULL_50_120]